MTGDAVLPELAAACPAARLATGADAVAGVVPRYAAAPASVGQASALLRAAGRHELSVVARGSGSRLDWGAPPRRCDLVVDTSRLDQVLEHAAGDLVARVQAGVSLHQLGELLAGAGQQLALDGIPGGNGQRPAGTIGGTLATGMAGPRRLRYGTPRDLVIGITVVRADGTVASSGGKVVKNVAGYDLGKLFAGSYGTLGLIAEAVFRLHPLPAVASYTTVDTVGDGARTSAGAPDWWGRIEATGGPGTLVRVAFWAAALPRVLAAIDTAAEAVTADPQVAGSAASGVLYAALPASTDPAAAAGFVTGLRAALARGDADGRPASAPVPDSPPVLASAVVVHAPPPVAALVDLWGPVPGLSLMRAVKDQFDPGHRMAPGRFAGGI